jgi:hypothetical protein
MIQFGGILSNLFLNLLKKARAKALRRKQPFNFNLRQSAQSLAIHLPTLQAVS